VTQEANELLRKALALPAEDRATLAGTLLDSLDTATDVSCEEAWNDEIANRIEGLASGKATTVSWEEVRRRVSTKLSNGR